MTGDGRAPAAGVEVLRVAERALLVRFLDADLARAVARAQALARALRAPALESGGESEAESKDESKDESKGERLSVEEGGGARLSLAGPARVADGNSFAHEGELASAELVLGAGNLLVQLPATRSASLERWREQLLLQAGPFSLTEGFSFGTTESEVPGAREHRFVVRYGGEEGPDLDAVAREAGLSVERVVELHAGAAFTVAFVGFSPGFGYLIGLPRELEVARLAAPRPRVPAGSVAIAGPFAGVYPSATPGGWRLIGRLARAPGAAPLFDPGADPPALLAPGDRVRFVPAGSAAGG